MSEYKASIKKSGFEIIIHFSDKVDLEKKLSQVADFTTVIENSLCEGLSIMENNQNKDDKVLLDYYTKSMQQHATITVAVFFGLFSILSIISGKTDSWLTRIGLSLSYFALGWCGHYEIERYIHYGTKAKEIAKKFGSCEGVEGKEIVKWVSEHIFGHIVVIYWFFIVYCLVVIWLGFFVCR